MICSAFNGLSQRVWLDLRVAGVDVATEVGGDAADMRAAATRFDPDLIVCPFLRQRIPADVWARWRTVVVHPGPEGDRGPSSLDWAISEGVREWGVTAIQAVDELDGGPVWAVRSFPMPSSTPTKSELYNGPVADRAVDLVREVVAKAADPSFVPRRPDVTDPAVPGRPRPPMRQDDRAFCWSDPTDHIVRRIAAADGSPGVRTTVRGQAVSVFDARPGPALDRGVPGAVLAWRHGAVLVRTGDATVWIGQVTAHTDSGVGIKLPAELALSGIRAGLPRWERRPNGVARDGFREIDYVRHGQVGVVSFDAYNGALSTEDCRRLAAALRRAASDDTRVLVLRGGQTFCNGLHLNVIEAVPDPAAAAWRNIIAIDGVCREIISNTRQLVVSAVTGNAGAGGVTMALGADRVLVRDGVVLNPHYRTMGLYGSEYWTYLMPRRVGTRRAAELTEQCPPVDAATALRIGLADEVLPAARFDADRAVLEYATSLAGSDGYRQQLAVKQARRADDERRRPLDAYLHHELAEMARDIYDDRHGFAAARRAFVTKQARPEVARRPAAVA